MKDAILATDNVIDRARVLKAVIEISRSTTVRIKQLQSNNAMLFSAEFGRFAGYPSRGSILRLVKMTVSASGSC